MCVLTWEQVHKHTLALGFNVDFSEDNDPMEELGDRSGPLETEPAALHSEVDDAEVPERREGFAGSLPADVASAEGLLSWLEDEGSYVTVSKEGTLASAEDTVAAKYKAAPK